MKKMIIALAASILSTTVNAANYEGDFEISGYYQTYDFLTWRAGPIVHVCGLMQRRKQVDMGNVSQFEYHISWYPGQENPDFVLRRGTGIVSSNGEVQWEDEQNLPPGGLLYLEADGSFTDPDYWSGTFKDATGQNFFFSSQFLVVPLNPGATEPDC